MSKNKHTPEPWHLCEVENETGRIKHLVPVDAEKMSLLTIVENDQATFAAIYNDDDARRIIACVNACEGIPTYQLTGEDGNPVILGDMIDLLRNQRDTLLPICEELRESAEYWSEYDVPLGIVERLTAAIASVKGGA